jgi:Tfp pilus assembly protein PilF
VQQDFNANSPAVSVDSEVLAGGNWNACTVLDKDQNLRACPTRRASGRAATRLADGLNLAWQGNLDRAIDAFGDAIRISPDFSQAYLNRGLAYQEKGDLRRALSDLDRAVSTDRNNASAYYHRGQVQRALGNTARADADEARAEELAN